MSLLSQNVRSALRNLRKSPAATTVAVLTLALAIGANTAIFSVAYNLLLAPLPFPDGGRLVQVVRQFSQGHGYSMSVPKYVAWTEDASRVLEGSAAFDSLGSGFNLTGGGLPERVVGSRVTAGFLPLFGGTPTFGRNFRPEEDRPGGDKVVVLSHGLWTRRFGGDRGLVGKAIQLNGEPYTVIGVAPARFEYPTRAELWTPFAFDRTSQDRAHYFEVVGRLRPGVSLAAAKAAMPEVRRRFEVSHPGFLDKTEKVGLVPLRERLAGQVRPALLVLLAAVAFVLLIACVNLANLQLARSAVRKREMAVRSALGASGGQLFRQMLTESVVLGLAGGALGLLLGTWGLRGLLSLAPVDLDPLRQIGLNPSVLVFTLGISLLTGLLFGMVPALQASRTNLRDPLQQGSSRSGEGSGSSKVRWALVVAETTLALILVIGAVLLVRSFAGLLGVDPGFDPKGVQTWKLSLPEGRYGDPQALGRWAGQLSERLSRLPGVKAAAVTATLPLEGGPDLPFTIEGRYQGGAPAAGEEPEGVGEAQHRAVSADFLTVLGIPVIRGRGFTASDSAGREAVALINEAAARKYWPKQDPIGQRITLGQPFVPELADPGPRTIVGVVRDVREVGLDQKAPEVVYVPLGQLPPAFSTMLVRLIPLAVVVRAEGKTAGLAEQVRKEVWALDPQQPVNDDLAMEEIVARSTGPQRFSVLLLGFLAVVALVLAAVGIYGVLAYLVEQRTREIGVRMALGATEGRVLRMVLGQGGAAVLVGVVLGLAGSFGLTRFLKSLLTGIGVHDPLCFVVAPLVLLGVALAASLIPARRASRLDPLVALRRD